MNTTDKFEALALHHLNMYRSENKDKPAKKEQPIKSKRSISNIDRLFIYKYNISHIYNLYINTYIYIYICIYKLTIGFCNI